MSPEGFEMCMKEGGKVKTMKVGMDKYMRICVDKMGKTHKGEMMMKKEQMPDKPMMKGKKEGMV